MSEIKLIDTPWGKMAICSKCDSEVMWQDCWNCEEGYSYHDCGEDTCCCIDPQPNVVCDICNGEGGWYVCISCVRGSASLPSSDDSAEVEQ